MLGARGSLGYMTSRVLRSVPGFRVLETVSPRFTSGLALDATCERETLEAFLAEHGPFDWVINCIAVLRPTSPSSSLEYADEARQVNSLFPHRLVEATRNIGARLIHVSTDAVFPAQAGVCTESTSPSPEDEYGRTKLAGELDDEHALTLRLSLIGPDPWRGTGLYEWVRNSDDDSVLPGFMDQWWTGSSTLQIAELCRRIIVDDLFASARAEGPIHHLCPWKPVTKYELLCGLRDALHRKIKIEPVESGCPINRQLDTNYGVLSGVLGRYKPLEPGLKQMAAMDASSEERGSGL